MSPPLRFLLREKVVGRDDGCRRGNGIAGESFGSEDEINGTGRDALTNFIRAHLRNVCHLEIPGLGRPKWVGVQDAAASAAREGNGERAFSQIPYAPKNSRNPYCIPSRLIPRADNRRLRLRRNIG